jgi:hypothetical protein
MKYEQAERILREEYGESAGNVLGVSLSPYRSKKSNEDAKKHSAKLIVDPFIQMIDDYCKNGC